MTDVKADILNQVKNRITLIGFFAGILLLIFAIMRINKWGPVEVVFLSGLGVLITVFSIDVQCNGKLPPLGVSGFLVSLAGVILYFFHDTYLSDTVSVLYSLGLTILFADIAMGFFSTRRVYQDVSPGNPQRDPDIAFAYKTAIERKLSDAMSSVDGLISQLSQEKARMNSEVKKEIITLMEALDALESIRHTDDNKAVGMLYNRLDEHLKLRDISEIPAKPGDRYNSTYHKSITKMPKAGMKGTIKKTITKGYLSRVENEDEVIRKTVVEIEWEEP